MTSECYILNFDTITESNSIACLGLRAWSSAPIITCWLGTYYFKARTNSTRKSHNRAASAFYKVPHSILLRKNPPPPPLTLKDNMLIEDAKMCIKGGDYLHKTQPSIFQSKIFQKEGTTMVIE